MKTSLTFSLLVLIFAKIECKCRHSYVTFCDDLNDLTNNEVENWSELVVGSDSDPDSRLRSIDYDSISLDRFDKLTHLTIIGQIDDLKSNTFDIEPEQSKLTYLNLYGNDIKRIRFSTFAAATLRKLSLVNNSIEYIHKEAFYNCEIQTIDLSHNKLESIEPDVFTEEFLSNQTKEIILRHNRIEAIASNSFPTSLEILNLDYNNLKYLHHDIFDSLCNLQEITMSHNKLPSLPNFKKLQSIITIDASYNDIVAIRIEDFNELSQLEVLDLSHNKIQYASFFTKFNFPQRHPPLQISLAFNSLTHLIICDNSFRHHIVILYGNPWNCRCWQSLEKFMVDNKVRRDKCDLQYFGNGEIPYCIEDPGNDCKTASFKKPNITKDALQEFLNIVGDTQNRVGCRLKPRRL